MMYFFPKQISTTYRFLLLVTYLGFKLLNLKFCLEINEFFPKNSYSLKCHGQIKYLGITVFFRKKLKVSKLKFEKPGFDVFLTIVVF